MPFLGLNHPTWTEAQKKTRLLCRDANGYSALHSALLNDNCVEAIKTYIQAIINSELSKETKVALLSSNDHENFPVLYRALLTGDYTETVKHYLITILNSSLAPQIKMQILSADDGNGSFALPTMFLLAKTEMLELYVQTILDSDLSLTEKKHLITEHFFIEGPSVLLTAIHEGHATTVRRYLEMVTAAAIPLPSDVILEVTWTYFDKMSQEDLPITWDTIIWLGLAHQAEDPLARILLEVASAQEKAASPIDPVQFLSACYKRQLDADSPLAHSILALLPELEPAPSKPGCTHYELALTGLGQRGATPHPEQTPALVA